MKALFIKSVTLLWAIFVLGSISPLNAENNVRDYITVSGVVKDKLSKKKLEYVNVSVTGTNLGTVTNEEGAFSLKIRKSVQPKKIKVSHVGYSNMQITVGEDEVAKELTLWLTPSDNVLKEVVIRPETPRLIIEQALRKIPVNYSPDPNMMTGFYREMAQKGHRYIHISEALIDVYKTSYNRREVDKDRVRIFKGRRLLSQKKNDTLAVKLVGGPNLSVYLDLVKNRDCLFSQEELIYYNFDMEEPTQIDDRVQFVISFRPKVRLSYPLFYGKIYIDRERLSFTRAEFNLSMDDKNKVTEAILRKKPFGLHFKPQEVSFLVTYKDHDGITYLNYIRNGIRFKCDWRKKLFSTSYTMLSEMVVTDRNENDAENISYKSSFKQDQVFSDNVENFSNDDFWTSYNIIEPTESLENAVQKLKKQQK